MHFTLCDMFSDLTQNAVEAGSSLITVVIEQTDRNLFLKIEDNGKGMTPEQLQLATDPFYTDGIKHPGRKIGLGIPFLIQTAETTGGTWNIKSEKNGTTHGTVVECNFDLTNIDTPPLGDVTGYFRQILTFNARYEMVIKRTAPAIDYTVRRSELLEVLGLDEAGTIEDVGALNLVKTYLESCEQ